MNEEEIVVNEEFMSPFIERRLLQAQLVSLGLSEDYASRAGLLQSHLKEGVTKLNQCKHGPSNQGKDLDVIGVGSATGNALLHHDLLMPGWDDFVEALSSVDASDQGFIHLILKRVQLDKKVTHMLLQAFKTAPLKILSLRANDLGNDGLVFAAEAIKVNSKLICLDIKGNRIESELDARALIKAMSEHHSLDIAILDGCEIGSNIAIMKAVLPVLTLDEVSLDGNFIDSYGARVIANSLASNPEVHVLYLQNNLLGDEEARMFAESLKTNSNLQLLILTGNLITTSEARVLSRALVNVSSLNEMNDCNHTCCVDLGDEDLMIKRNQSLDPVRNREMKLLNLLICGANIFYTGDLHIGVMPRIIDFIQRQGMHDIERTREGLEPYKYNCLEEMFLFVREWNMPLLYTSCIGPKVRRSERIRKSKVVQLMGK